MWRQATSTTGGLVAVIVAACLVGLLVLALLGAGVFVVARTVADHEGGRARVVVRQDGALPPGQQRKLDRAPNDRGMMPRARGRQNGNGNGLGNGLGGLGPALRGLGALEHGEVTVTGADGRATVMTVQRGSVTAVTATKLTVKSSDGFSASYTLDASTRGRTTGLQTGDAVTVLATKQGAKAVLVR